MHYFVSTFHKMRFIRAGMRLKERRQRGELSGVVEFEDNLRLVGGGGDMMLFVWRSAPELPNVPGSLDPQYRSLSVGVAESSISSPGQDSEEVGPSY
jgi:hypothetical protein